MFNRLTARINQRKVTYSRYNHIEKVYEVLGRTSPQQKRRGSKKPLCINPWQVEDSRGVLPEPRDCQLFSWRPTLFYLCFPSPFSNVDPGSRNSPKESGFTICKMNDTFPSSWNKECFFNNNFLRVVFCLWALRTYTVRVPVTKIFSNLTVDIYWIQRDQEGLFWHKYKIMCTKFESGSISPSSPYFKYCTMYSYRAGRHSPAALWQKSDHLWWVLEAFSFSTSMCYYLFLRACIMHLFAQLLSSWVLEVENRICMGRGCLALRQPLTLPLASNLW